jgi:hypothetical protein
MGRVMDLSIVISVISALIALASAYVAWRATKPLPDLVSRITFALPLGTRGSTPVLLVHISVTNRATLPVQLVAYELDLVLDSGEKKPLRSVNGTEYLVHFPLAFGEDENWGEVTLTQENFLRWPPRLVGYGQMLMGWLLFENVREEAEWSKVVGYRLRFTDALGGTWDAELSRAESQAWIARQEWRSPNLVDLVAASGGEVTEAPHAR